MTAKDVIERALEITGYIEENTEKLLQATSAAEKVTAAITGEAGGGSPNFDKMADIVAKITKLKHEAIKSGEAQFDAGKDAVNIIALLDSPIHRQVLYKRYILAKSFRRIAKEMGYTYRNILYIHDNAVLKLEKKLAESGKGIDFSH